MSMFLGLLRVVSLMLIVVWAVPTVPAADTRQESSISALTELANDLHERAANWQAPTRFPRGSSWLVICALVVIACLPQTIMRA